MHRQALLYRHLPNMDTSLLWTVYIVIGKRRSLHFNFSKFKLLNTDTPLILHCLSVAFLVLSVRINMV